MQMPLLRDLAPTSAGNDDWRWIITHAISFVAAWRLFRLLLTLLGRRLLRCPTLSVGWFSINDLHWDWDTSSPHTATGTTTAKVQAIHIDRLGLVSRWGSAKGRADHHAPAGSVNGASSRNRSRSKSRSEGPTMPLPHVGFLTRLAYRRPAWVGLAVSGVRIDVCLTPIRSTGSGDAGDKPPHSPPGTPMRRASVSSSSSSSRPAISRANTAEGSPMSRTATPSPATPAPSNIVMRAARAFLSGTAMAHDIRREVRTFLLGFVPRQHRIVLSRTLRKLRHHTVAPALHYLNAAGRRGSALTLFLALEVADVRVVFPQLDAELSLGLLRVGAEIVRGGLDAVSAHPHVGAWVRAEKLALTLASVPSATSPSTPGLGPGPPASSSLAEEPKAKVQAKVKARGKVLRAFELPGPLFIEAKAPFDPAIGIAGLYHRNAEHKLEPRKTILDLEIAFPPLPLSAHAPQLAGSGSSLKSGASTSLSVNTDALLLCAQRAKDSISPNPRLHLGPHLGPHVHGHEHSHSRASGAGGGQSQAGAEHDDTGAPSGTHHDGRHDFTGDREQQYHVQDIQPRQNPAAMLKSIRICIPLIRVASHVTSARDTLSPLSSKDAKGQGRVSGYSMEARLRSFALECAIGGKVHKGDKHVEWFGRNASLKATAKVGFEKLDVDVSSMESDSGSSLSRPIRFLEFSPSGVHVSSSWLPGRLDALFTTATSSTAVTRAERANNLLFAEDRSVNRLVVEADLGGVSGEAPIEMLDDLLHMLPRRHRKWREASTRLSAPPGSSRWQEDDSPSYVDIYDPPALAVAIEVGRCGYRVIGPQDAPHKTAFGPGEDDADLSSGWCAPSALCLHIPSASFHVTSQYIDACLKRTDAQRREARNLLRRGKIAIPDVLASSLSSRLKDDKADAERPGMSRRDRKTLFDDIENGQSEDTNTSYMSAAPDPFSASARSQSYSPAQTPPPSDGKPELRSRRERLKEVLHKFISPQSPMQAPFNPPLFAHRRNEADLERHPFVYKVHAGATVERVEVYLLSAAEQQARTSNRTNPTSAGPSRFPASQHQHQQSGTGARGHGHGQNTSGSHARRQSRPTIKARHEICYFGPLQASSEVEFTGGEIHQPSGNDESAFVAFLDTSRRQGHVRVLVESIGGDVSRFDVHHSLNGVMVVLAEALASRRGEERHAQDEQLNHENGTREAQKTPKPFVRMLPPDIYLSLSLADVNFHLAGPDPKFDPSVCRGLAFQASNVTLEYHQLSRHLVSPVEPRLRASLALVDDIRTHANAEQIVRPHIRQAFFRLHIKDTRLNPVKDAGQESRILKAKTAVDSGGAESALAGEGAGTWEYKNRDKLAEPTSTATAASGPSGSKRSISHAFIKDFFWLPNLTARISVWSEKDAKNAENEGKDIDHVGVVVQAPTLIARIELFQVYCFLMAFSAFRSLKPQASVPPGVPMSTGKTASLRPEPVLRYIVDFVETHIYLTLPHEVRLFGRIKRFHVANQGKDVTLNLDHALVAGASIISAGQWDDILRMRDWQISIVDEPGNSGYHEHAIYAQGSGARLRIPFKYPFSIIIDNSATFIKTIKQLVHQFVKDRYDSAIQPVAEKPKRLPKIKVALKILVLEAEDDPFETKLGLICRTGKEEQKERIARERAFEAKAAAIRKDMQLEAQRAESDSDDGSQERSSPQRGRNGWRPPKVSIEDAYAVLQSLHSRKWVQRHRAAVATKDRREEGQVRRLYGTMSATLSDHTLPIHLSKSHVSAPLLRMVLDNPAIELTQPHFDQKPDGLADFLAEVGKGMPRETQYSLIVPFHLDWQMSEARVHVRDYPLHLLYIPPVQQSHSTATSWHLSTDFVIAEELGEANSFRKVPAEIVPRSISGGPVGYILQVPRTAMPVKTYAKPVIDIVSVWATRLGWGNSIQPAIQDIMRVLDSLTKAPPDPSERMGFWDKLRLILHWQVTINLRGDGPLHFILKGSRDPYDLDGEGAGFALCYERKVRWHIGVPNVDNEFFQILSESFILGIPDLKDFRDAAATGVIKRVAQKEGDDRSTAAQSAHSEGQHHTKTFRRTQDFRKVCAKFMGGVKWGLRLDFERTCRKENCEHQDDPCQGRLIDHKCRFINDFKPHYEVHTLSGADVNNLSPDHDSYFGFRSDFVHASISVIANMHDGSTDVDERSANSIHLTPNGFTHFWAWWHLFDGTMSLPVRHGALFPSTQPPSKKFGRHTATIKYRLQLAPVYIAHTYKQESWQDWRDSRTTVLGVKGRIGIFNVDMHQRMQEEPIYNTHLEGPRTRLHKSFNRAEIDCKGVDLRTIAARFIDPNKAHVDIGQEGDDTDLGELLGLSDTTALPDEDLIWVDLDDYHDLSLFLPDMDPTMRIIPCFKSHQLVYSRYSQADPLTQNVAPSKFGDETTHECLLNKSPNAIDVQLEAAQGRVDELREDVREKGRPSSHYTVEKVDRLKRQLAAAEVGLARLKAFKERQQSGKGTSDHTEQQQNLSPEVLIDHDHIADFTAYEGLERWINRLIVHNPNLVISQQIRDILLRYYYSSRENRLFQYAMTSRAIKFIRELAEGLGGVAKRREELRRQRTSSKRGPDACSSRTGSTNPQRAPRQEDLLGCLLNDEGLSWSIRDRPDQAKGAAGDVELDAESSVSGSGFDLDPDDEASRDLPENHQTRNSFLVSLLKPQIALNSDSDSSSTVILTSMSVQLRVFAVVDTKNLKDPINSNVMHRSFGSIHALQAFYPHLKGWRSGRKDSLLSDRRNFVPMEVLLGGADDLEDLDRIVPRTSARLRYDKHNGLRLLRDGKEGSAGSSLFKSTLDRLAFECERFSVSATPKHYAAIYDVVTNLLLYADPEQKARSQKVETVVLSKDFSDRQGIANNVQAQQEELRILRQREISWMQTGYTHLSVEELQTAYSNRVESIKKMDLLTLWMGAMQTAQDSKASTKTMGMQLDAKASEIVWHMRDMDEHPLIKVSVKGVEFRWLNRNDGKVSNALVIKDLTALNSRPEPVFSEIVSKYTTLEGSSQPAKQSDVFIVVLWHMLSPVGGISIVENFQVLLHPIRLQLEQRLGKEIQDYLFAERAKSKKKEHVNGMHASVHGSSTSLQSMDQASQHSGGRRLRGAASSDSLQAPRRSVDTHSLASDDGSSLYLAPHTSSSQLSPHGNGSGQRNSSLRQRSSSDISALVRADDNLDADEMRARSRVNRTFLHVEFVPTVLCLSFKGDKQTSLYDIYGLIYKSPTIIHCNRIWTYGELVNQIKKDFARSIWSQGATLIGQILTTARHKPRSAANAVQQRLINAVSDRDRSGEPKRVKSLTGSLRSRGASNDSTSTIGGSVLSADHVKTSPLRMVARYSSRDDDAEIDVGVDVDQSSIGLGRHASPLSAEVPADGSSLDATSTQESPDSHSLEPNQTSTNGSLATNGALRSSSAS